MIKISIGQNLDIRRLILEKNVVLTKVLKRQLQKNRSFNGVKLKQQTQSHFLPI